MLACSRNFLAVPHHGGEGTCDGLPPCAAHLSRLTRLLLAASHRPILLHPRRDFVAGGFGPMRRSPGSACGRGRSGAALRARSTILRRASANPARRMTELGKRAVDRRDFVLQLEKAGLRAEAREMADLVRVVRGHRFMNPLLSDYVVSDTTETTSNANPRSSFDLAPYRTHAESERGEVRTSGHATTSCRRAKCSSGATDGRPIPRPSAIVFTSNRASAACSAHGGW